MSMMMRAAVQAVDEGLTAGEIVSSLPFDPFSIFALVLLAGAFAAVVYFGTRTWAAPDEKPLDEGSGTPGGPRGGTSSGEGGPKGGRRAA